MLIKTLTITLKKKKKNYSEYHNCSINKRLKNNLFNNYEMESHKESIGLISNECFDY